jgi:UDP-N-acetylmuramoyl-tripeptide--D-alanyl-D-alanine ligase
MKELLWNGKEVLSAIKGHGSDDWNASGISIDSRTLNPGDIFFALYGKNYDGHDFIPEALDGALEITTLAPLSKASGIKSWPS